MSKFTTKQSADKPPKPYSDFPLFAHATGHDGRRKSAENCITVAADLHAGREPREDTDGITVRGLRATDTAGE